jgi:hypothetical protein
MFSDEGTRGTRGRKPSKFCLWHNFVNSTHEMKALKGLYTYEYLFQRNSINEHDVGVSITIESYRFIGNQLEIIERHSRVHIVVQILDDQLSSCSTGIPFTIRWRVHMTNKANIEVKRWHRTVHYQFCAREQFRRGLYSLFAHRRSDERQREILLDAVNQCLCSSIDHSNTMRFEVINEKTFDVIHWWSASYW